MVAFLFLFDKNKVQPLLIIEHHSKSVLTSLSLRLILFVDKLVETTGNLSLLFGVDCFFVCDNISWSHALLQ